MTSKEPEKGMAGGKKLKDYPPVPGTPPPPEKKDKSLVSLEAELEHERLYLDALHKENRELEKILQNYDKELSYIKGNFPQNLIGDGKVHADNELWFKYEAQVEVNKKLEREKKHLEYELRQIEEQGVINLDSLSQSELIMYVKQLERTKTDLTSDLRAKEWSLDKQSKDFHHLDEIRKALEAEIRHYDEELAMFRHYKKVACPSASLATSHQSLHTQSARRAETGKSRDEKKSTERLGKPFEKRNSLSHEDITDTPKNDIMFSSLDESKLESLKTESPTLGFQRRTAKGGIPDNKRVLDPKKGPIKKTVAVGALPEISRTQTKTPPAGSKAKTSKPAGNKVGTDTPRPRSGGIKSGIPKSNPIKIVVTDETESDEKLKIEKKPIPVKEIPDEENFIKSGMAYASLKNFENSPPPKPEGDSKTESKKFTFEESTLKSLTGIDVIEEEYEEELEDSDSEAKNKDLTEKYHGKEIAQVKPLSRKGDDDEKDDHDTDDDDEKDEKKKDGSSTARV